jgi:hypothetical protein
MGWIVSAGKLSRTSFESGRNAGVITSPEMRITSTPCPGQTQWRFIPNADRITFMHYGEQPSWQSRKICREVLSHLVGAI